MTILEAIDLSKTYTGGDGGEIAVLDGLNLAVERGEIVAIVGASGAGKSTLLHLLGGLDVPTRGSVRVAGETLVAAQGHAASDHAQPRARGRRSHRLGERAADDA